MPYLSVILFLLLTSTVCAVWVSGTAEMCLQWPWPPLIGNTWSNCHLRGFCLPSLPPKPLSLALCQLKPMASSHQRPQTRLEEALPGFSLSLSSLAQIHLPTGCPLFTMNFYHALPPLHNQQQPHEHETYPTRLTPLPPSLSSKNTPHLPLRTVNVCVSVCVSYSKFIFVIKYHFCCFYNNIQLILYTCMCSCELLHFVPPPSAPQPNSPLPPYQIFCTCVTITSSLCAHCTTWPLF